MGTMRLVDLNNLLFAGKFHQQFNCMCGYPNLDKFNFCAKQNISGPLRITNFSSGLLAFKFHISLIFLP